MPIVAQRKAATVIAASVNPKLDIINLVGDLSKEEVLYDLVLVGTYFRPEKTAGGIIRPQENVQEDQWQSKTGLVLKMGPEADDKVQVGDWVVYSVSDGWALSVNEYPCRLVPSNCIRMKVSKPEIAF